LTRPRVLAVLDRYAEAYKSEDVRGLAALFTPTFERQLSGGSIEDKAEALRVYRGQFVTLRRRTYRLQNRAITLANESTEAQAPFEITDRGRRVGGGTISFSVVWASPQPQITKIVVRRSSGEDRG
jgi:hypothetical protein